MWYHRLHLLFRVDREWKWHHHNEEICEEVLERDDCSGGIRRLMSHHHPPFLQQFQSNTLVSEQCFHMYFFILWFTRKFYLTGNLKGHCHIVFFHIREPSFLCIEKINSRDWPVDKSRI